MMPDPDRVREALASVEQIARSSRLYRDTHESLAVVIAAARSWLEGTEIRWCEEHESSLVKSVNYCQVSDFAIAAGYSPPPCRIVSRRLVGGE